MEHDDNQNKLIFTAAGAWLGVGAYLTLSLIIAAIYLFG
ncbi:hypothetical protein AQULUS_08770 [Aquicella lusitana]|uniref:Uncharacterized protein n=1 Tax=Aquicella lusitana TaxID=254246 RepID=A0A370GCY7_9COXI|nr:hypothetical protein C8D86_1265 [Aquicella lusitana]VVC73146.1 hypothetical protein AQULUS_08770 [Aquicella lusitana]